MKINPYGTQGINPYKRQTNKLDQTGKTAGKSADKVEISSAAKEMQQGVSDIETQRQTKINELKMQIENGTYQADSKTAAKSMINYYSKN